MQLILFRNGDYIYISNKEGEDTILTGEIIPKRIFDDSQVTASLIKHLFQDIQRKISELYSGGFLSIPFFFCTS
jgi:hypothetical protein